MQILFNLHNSKGRVSVAQGRDTEYNLLSDEFARRTFDESGNYTVRPFQIQVQESVTVNENVGRFTVGVPRMMVMLRAQIYLQLKISSGKAYVNGYEIEKECPINQRPQ